MQAATDIDSIGPSVPMRAIRRVIVVAVHYRTANGHIQCGGAEKYTHQVVRALLEAGLRVHVGYSGDSIYDDLLTAAGGRLTLEYTNWIDANLSGDARLGIRTILDRRRWLAARSGDALLAVQQNAGASFAASLVAARTLGLRVVSSIRQEPIATPVATGKCWLGVIPSPELWRRRLRWRRRLAALSCDALIFNSRRVADAHVHTFGLPSNRIHVIPNGETVPDLAKTRSYDSPCRIGTVGRVTSAKGADLLLDAFCRIASKHPQAQLTYYGDGPLIPDLRRKAASRGIVDRVRFAGHCSDRDALYADLDVYVQPSRRESMSNSVLEAMARGLPCIVSDAGGLPETIEYGITGLVVPRDNEIALADALDRLLCDQGRCVRFGEAAINRVRRHFSLEDVMRRTVQTILGATRVSREGESRAEPGEHHTFRTHKALPA